MDMQRKQTGLVTGKTFTTSAPMGSYSQSQIIPYTPPRPTHVNNNVAKKKSVTKSKSFSWSLDDPELKRRRRVASYKAYTVEGRIKFSLRSGVRWIKNKYLDIRYGWL
ncbi:hypothetical protein KP509_16G067600 [Ceratopteris richardii]|uniref:Uncharacterized protein n=1 Tax=Ceratopteris richardii TaxID=49495 RepID=A0A8T2T167_CERRI|nr:hypothetical protein KP509_16G067600 [Ceratopteris richardii]